MKWNERRKLESESQKQERTRKTRTTERSRGRSQKRKRLDDTEKEYAYLLAMGMPWQCLNLGKPAFCGFSFVDLDWNPVPAITIPMAQTTDF